MHLLIMEDNEIRPGSFREIPEADFEIPKGREEPQITFADDLIAIYTAFRDQVYSPQSVLYPSSGFDASPVKVFDNVTFVDNEVGGNYGCVKKLQEAGLHALKQDIREYTSEQEHDLLILLNPVIPTEWASQYLVKGGYILTNDYHSNASKMSEQPDQFTLLGVIDEAERKSEKDEPIAIVSRNLDGLFEPVKDEEELIRFRPESHEFLGMVFRSFATNMSDFNADRPFGQVWADYREMMGEGREGREGREKR